MQSVHCLGKHTHRPVPHWASARDLAAHQIKPREPLPQTVVQLDLVFQEVWGDIPQAKMTYLILFMARSCRVVHDAYGLSRLFLMLLHLMVCCRQHNTTIKFCLANHDSRHITDSIHAKQCLRTVFTIMKCPVEIDVRFLVCSVYISTWAICQFIVTSWWESVYTIWYFGG